MMKPPCSFHQQLLLLLLFPVLLSLSEMVGHSLTAHAFVHHHHHHHRLADGTPTTSKTVSNSKNRISRSTPSMSSSSSIRTTTLYIFPRKKGEDVGVDGKRRSSTENDDNSNDNTPPLSDSNSNQPTLSSQNEKGGFSIPFLGRRLVSTSTNEGAVSTSPSLPVGADSPAAASSASSSSSRQQEQLQSTLNTPEQEARRLRDEAERMRLEAARMDAELTLTKISQLERKISSNKNSSNKKNLQPEELEAMQTQMETLQTKLTRMDDDLDPSSSQKDVSHSGTNNTVPSSSALSSSVSKSSSSALPIVQGGALAPLLERKRSAFITDIDKRVEDLENTPGFILKIATAALNYTLPKNLTDLVYRLEGLPVLPTKDPPVFTVAQVAARERAIREDRNKWVSTILPFLEGEDTTNTTRMALLSLEYEYYFEDEFSDEQISKRLSENFGKIVNDEPWLALNKSVVDATIESLYPKFMLQYGPEPSQDQVNLLVSELADIFSSTKPPEKVVGGYVIRGRLKKKTSAELMEAIDSLLESKPALKQSLNVFWTQEISIFSDPDAYDFESYDPSDIPPVLYVRGPNVVRPSRPLVFSIASATGLATACYLAVYPYLLNPVISSRVENDLALADAGMTPDLVYLSDLSLPLFFVFMGLQIIGELGHQAMAARYKVKLSVPTFVPSLITGITSTVTTFKTPPPTKAAMFDIALAGPLLSIMASLVALVIGSFMTLTSDTSLLPALPLEILRQSTLGGGVINSILGNDVLSIPEGAQGSAAIASITIPLHPVAVAGYISLIVNALALLPIGTTDGGRIALTLLGRGVKILVGNVFLFALLLVGLLGSDLFLFYFGFITLFQSGNDIAAKNEVDMLEFSRVIMAILAFMLMVLSLTPFQ